MVAQVGRKGRTPQELHYAFSGMQLPGDCYGLQAIAFHADLGL